LGCCWPFLFLSLCPSFTTLGTPGSPIICHIAACLIKKPRSRAHRTFTAHNRVQNQELVRNRPGECRRPHGTVFARAAILPAVPPALARWRRPQERVKKAEKKSFQVLPEPCVVHSNTAITPRSGSELKTLHTNTNDRISYRKPTAGTAYCPHWRFGCHQHLCPWKVRRA
jgi:hypothetical protein